MAAEAPMQVEESIPATQESVLAAQASEAHTTEAAMPVETPPAACSEDQGTQSPLEVSTLSEEPAPAALNAETKSSIETTVAPMPLSAPSVESSRVQDVVVPMAAFVKPDKPKKAVSAYWIYSCCVRDEVGRELKEKGSASRIGDIAKIIGQRWKDLPEAERKIYEDKAAVDKQRYDTEMIAYSEATDPVSCLRNKYKHLIPQRPPSAQSLFSQDAKHRQAALDALQTEGKDAGSREVSSKLAEMWREAGVEQRISYEAEHTKLQLQYLELLKPWQASPECKEIERAEAAHQQMQKVVELAKEAVEARQKEEERAAKKRARPANQKVIETPPKRGRAAQQSTPPPAAKKPIEDKVLKEASKLGLAVALENLANRPEIASSRKTARAVLDALKASGGLVNPAKRALLGL